MTPFDVLLDLAARVLLLSLPLTVAVLALRRLLLSRSSNVWLYAAMVGYTVFSAVGVLPWAATGKATPIALFLFALSTPLVWTLVILVTGTGRSSPYGTRRTSEPESGNQPVVLRLDKLVLKDPITPEPAATPIFRHHKSSNQSKAKASSSVMGVARSMRGRASSEARRVRKLLPPPAPERSDLPFLR